MRPTPLRRSPFAALVALATLAAGAASAAEPGHLWQVETSMEMPGMKMPGRSQQVCAPANAEGPEAMSGGDSECTMSNVRRAPGKFSYDVSCPQGSGTGEMIYQGKDSYTSTMTMTTEGRTMKMVTRGKRMGDCDASQVKKQVAAAQAQADAGMAQMCAGMAESLMPGNLATYQCDAKYKTDLCRRFETKAGFGTVASRQPTGQPALDSGTLPEVARFCGADAAAIRTRLCGEANRSQDLAFLGSSCPSEAKVIAQRECAGRSFSSPPAPRYREFCGTYARASMQAAPGEGGAAEGETAAGEPADGESAPAQAPSTAGDAVEQGARKLRGMLGF